MDGRPLLHPEGGERDLIFLRLRIHRLGRHLIHRRCEQPPALGCEIELVAHRLRKGQPLEVGPRRRVEGDDRAPLRFEADGLHAREASDLVGPGARGIDEDRCGKAISLLAGDLPRAASPLDRGDPLAGAQLAAAAHQPPQIALEHRVRIEVERVEIGDSVARILLQQRAEVVDSRGVEMFERGKGRNLGVEPVQRLALVVARMHEHRHPVAERHVGETLGRVVEEGPAGERQRAHQAVAERIMEHRRASARRMVAGLLFRLENQDSSMAGQRRCRGKSGNPTPDDEDVGAGHADVSRSFTTLPLCVSRIALTISSSSGSTGRPWSLSQKALRKL